MAHVISMPTAMDAGKMSDERRAQLDEVIRETRVFGRRAKTPEGKIALAEIEHELLEIKKRWERAGLINGQEMLPLAAEAPTKR